MRLALIGQQAFGRAVLDAFKARGDTIAGVFVAPEKPGTKPDPLRARAEELGIPVFQFQRYSAEEPLPAHRGPSSINWPIMLGKRETGLTIFRPSDGLDEGPVILQKTIAIGPDDTLGSVYFDRIFPLGVAALLEAADLVIAGRAQERVQDESRASYEGWVREAESHIAWGHPLDVVNTLTRG